VFKAIKLHPSVVYSRAAVQWPARDRLIAPPGRGLGRRAPGNGLIPTLPVPGYPATAQGWWHEAIVDLFTCARKQYGSLPRCPGADAAAALSAIRGTCFSPGRGARESLARNAPGGAGSHAGRCGRPRASVSPPGGIRINLLDKANKYRQTVLAEANMVLTKHYHGSPPWPTNVYRVQAGPRRGSSADRGSLGSLSARYRY